MKIRIELDSDFVEEEIIIKCASISDDIAKLEKLISAHAKSPATFLFLRDGKEYFLPVSEVLIFETESSVVYAHFKTEVYRVKQKLYELENLLPNQFTRVSKSAIINVDKVMAVTYNIAATSLVEFRHSHKKVYASRHYYKELKERLQERINYEK